jgi:hypothetical protein
MSYSVCAPTGFSLYRPTNVQRIAVEEQHGLEVVERVHVLDVVVQVEIESKVRKRFITIYLQSLKPSAVNLRSILG